MAVFIFVGEKANCLAFVRDLKGAAMFLFEPRQFAAKGKNREPGLQVFSVRETTGRQVPSPVKFSS